MATCLPVPAFADTATDLAAAKAGYDAKMAQFGYSYAMQVRSFLLARSYALNDGTFTEARRNEIAQAVADYASRLDGNDAERDRLVDAYNRAGLTAERDAFMARFAAAQQLHRADLTGLAQSILGTPPSSSSSAPAPVPAAWPLPEAPAAPAPAVAPAAPAASVPSTGNPTPSAIPQPASVADAEPAKAFVLAQAAARQRSVFSRELFIESRNQFSASLDAL